MLNFSLDHSYKDCQSPIRPHKVEQLFSPSTFQVRTPTSNYDRVNNRISKGDVTYQVPLKIPPNDDVASMRPPAPLLQSVKNYENLGLPSTPANINATDYFPRCSTGLKGPGPPPPIHTALTDESSTHAALTCDESSRQDILSSSFENYDLMDRHQQIPHYKPFHQIKDDQPIRATCFHPLGEVYVIGSNVRKLRICHYPTVEEFKQFTRSHFDTDYTASNLYPQEPEYAFQFLQIHLASIYCASFNDSGTLLATGSNDKTVHVVQYDSEKHLPKSNEYKLTQHSSTVRDLIFMPSANQSGGGHLISAGAGDNEIIVTDCNTMKPVRVLRGHHENTVMSLHRWQDENYFVSGSLDGTIKLWDVRSNLCCSTITGTLQQQQQQTNDQVNGQGKTPVGVVRVENSGKLLVAGYKSGHCMLYDLKGGRVVQSFKAHEDEIRSLNFSPKSYYLLTSSYDKKVKLMDLQGELTRKLPSVEIGQLNDKVVQTCWHPNDYTFVTTNADGTATLWSIPDLMLAGGGDA